MNVHGRLQITKNVGATLASRVFSKPPSAFITRCTCKCYVYQIFFYNKSRRQHIKIFGKTSDVSVLPTEKWMVRINQSERALFLRYVVTTTKLSSLWRLDKGLKLETSAFESLYGGLMTVNQQ